MAAPKDKHNPEAVTAHIAKLDPALRELVEAIRQVILSAGPLIGEQVKWNSPAFFYTGDMPPFDPKEYKRDMVVLNLHKGTPLLVFPTGARVNDTTGLLEGNYTDGRRLARINSPADLEEKEAALQFVVQQWLQLVTI
ncbi:MAG: DUF1801 domain-containing protein [Mucilaginibacter sp.]